MSRNQFRQRQKDLRNRVGRLPERSLVRRRLERELRGIVQSELRRETAPDLRIDPARVEEDANAEAQPKFWWIDQ